MWEWLSGKKTYIVAGLIGLLAGIYAVDVQLTDNPLTPTIETSIPASTYEWLRTVLLGGGLAALRAGKQS